MRRSAIGLLVILALGTVWLPLAAVPRQKGPTIGVLLFASPPSEPDWKQRSVFLQELRRLGWRDGENVTVEFRWASGQFERGGDLAAELVRLNVDVIYVDNVLIRAVQQATTTIPIVMFAIIDPVAAGFIASLAQPGGNITGVDASFIIGLGGKLLELLTEVVSPHARVAVLSNPNAPSVASMVQEVKDAAQTLGTTLVFLEARAPEEFAGAFDTARREGAGALLILPSVVFSLHLKQLAALAVQHRLPAIYARLPFAQEGGLLAYGPNHPALLRRVAYYIDRILRDAKPADLPVERPTKFDLIINLKTAETLGLTIPPTLLFQADEVIK